MIVHVTERQMRKECKRKWYYQSYLGLVKNPPNPDYFWEGTGGHYALAHYYRDGADIELKFYQWYQEEIAKNKWDGKALEIAEEKYKMISGLLKHYPAWSKPQEADWEIVEVETPIEMPVAIIDQLGKPQLVTLTGTIDLLIRRNGKLYFVDHKFYKRLVQADSLRQDDQFTAYSWLVWKKFGIMPAGGYCNQFYKQFPAQIEIIRQGTPSEGLSKKKSALTTREFYLEQILANGYDPIDYVDILMDLQQQENPFYLRVPTLRRPGQLVAFEEQLKWELTDMFNLVHYGSPLNDDKCFPTRTKDCGRCLFDPMCTAKLEGADPKEMIGTLYLPTNGINYGTEMEN